MTILCKYWRMEFLSWGLLAWFTFNNVNEAQSQSTNSHSQSDQYLNMDYYNNHTAFSTSEEQNYLHDSSLPSVTGGERENQYTEFEKVYQELPTQTPNEMNVRPMQGHMANSFDFPYDVVAERQSNFIPSDAMEHGRGELNNAGRIRNQIVTEGHGHYNGWGHHHDPSFNLPGTLSQNPPFNLQTPGTSGQNPPFNFPGTSVPSHGDGPQHGNSIQTQGNRDQQRGNRRPSGNRQRRPQTGGNRNQNSKNIFGKHHDFFRQLHIHHQDKKNVFGSLLQLLLAIGKKKINHVKPVISKIVSRKAKDAEHLAKITALIAKHIPIVAEGKAKLLRKMGQLSGRLLKKISHLADLVSDGNMMLADKLSLAYNMLLELGEPILLALTDAVESLADNQQQAMPPHPMPLYHDVVTTHGHGWSS